MIVDVSCSGFPCASNSAIRASSSSNRRVESTKSCSSLVCMPRSLRTSRLPKIVSSNSRIVNSSPSSYAPALILRAVIAVVSNDSVPKREWIHTPPLIWRVDIDAGSRIALQGQTRVLGVCWHPDPPFMSPASVDVCVNRHQIILFQQDGRHFGPIHISSSEQSARLKAYGINQRQHCVYGFASHKWTTQENSKRKLRNSFSLPSYASLTPPSDTRVETYRVRERGLGTVRPNLTGANHRHQRRRRLLSTTIITSRSSREGCSSVDSRGLCTRPSSWCSQRTLLRIHKRNVDICYNNSSELRLTLRPTAFRDRQAHPYDWIEL